LEGLFLPCPWPICLSLCMHVYLVSVFLSSGEFQFLDFSCRLRHCNALLNIKWLTYSNTNRRQSTAWSYFCYFQRCSGFHRLFATSKVLHCYNEHLTSTLLELTVVVKVMFAGDRSWKILLQIYRWMLVLQTSDAARLWEVAVTAISRGEILACILTSFSMVAERRVVTLRWFRSLVMCMECTNPHLLSHL
jgi:hypothetical protein